MKSLLAIIAVVMSFVVASCGVTRDVAIEVLQNSQLTATGYVKGDSVCTEFSVTHPLVGKIQVYSGCVALKPAEADAQGVLARPVVLPILTVDRPIMYVSPPIETGPVKLNENEADGIPDR